MYDFVVVRGDFCFCCGECIYEVFMGIFLEFFFVLEEVGEVYVFDYEDDVLVFFGGYVLFLYGGEFLFNGLVGFF